MGAMVLNTKYLFEKAPKKSALFFKPLNLLGLIFNKFRSTFFIKENKLKHTFYLRKELLNGTSKNPNNCRT